jgi:hypothetical protein
VRVLHITPHNRMCNVIIRNLGQARKRENNAHVQQCHTLSGNLPAGEEEVNQRAHTATRPGGEAMGAMVLRKAWTSGLVLIVGHNHGGF